ncbi:hypothetical protein [Mesorhizobium sp. ISC15]|uniref:hypothetical protein n=1 Tax=Mesorhizobium sp. ISC15 TaxID=3076429 RepID=UPI00301D4D16
MQNATTSLALFNQHDMSVICVEDKSRAGICVTNDIDFAVRLAKMAGTCSVSIESTTAVTELIASVLRVHLEGDYERAILLARQIHERMYPGSIGEPFGSRMAKRRSPFSSLLVRATKARGSSQ